MLPTVFVFTETEDYSRKDIVCAAEKLIMSEKDVDGSRINKQRIACIVK